MSDSQAKGETFQPGTPEDVRLTYKILNEFFSAKLKATDLYHAKGEASPATATKSVCNVDGTTDGDD
jgi:hypothetical protein